MEKSTGLTNCMSRETSPTRIIGYDPRIENKVLSRRGAYVEKDSKGRNTLKAIAARVIGSLLDLVSLKRMMPMDGSFSAFIPLRPGPGKPSPHRTTSPSRTHTPIRLYSLTDVTGWRYLRRPPDLRLRGAQNWARNRTTPNESEEPGSDRTPVPASWRTNEHRSSSPGTGPRPCYKLPGPPPLNPFAPSRGDYYGAFILSLFTYPNFFLSFLLSHMIALGELGEVC